MNPKTAVDMVLKRTALLEIKNRWSPVSIYVQASEVSRFQSGHFLRICSTETTKFLTLYDYPTNISVRQKETAVCEVLQNVTSNICLLQWRHITTT